jgi:hypothetical protein
MRPEFDPGVDVVGRDHFIIATLLNGEREAVGNNKGGIPTTDWLRP